MLFNTPFPKFGPKIESNLGVMTFGSDTRIVVSPSSKNGILLHDDHASIFLCGYYLFDFVNKPLIAFLGWFGQSNISSYTFGVWINSKIISQEIESLFYIHNSGFGFIQLQTSTFQKFVYNWFDQIFLDTFRCCSDDKVIPIANHIHFRGPLRFTVDLFFRVPTVTTLAFVFLVRRCLVAS